MSFTIFLILIALLFSYEIFRRYKSFTIVFFVLFPIFCIPLWITYGSLGWFEWVKAYSLVTGVVLITMGRYPKFMNNQKLFDLVYFILGVNILEAVIKDAYTFNLVTVLNMIIGLLLITSLIDSRHKIHIDRSSTMDFITPKLTLPWILIYTIWNWVFIYSEYTPFAPRHFAVLAAPLIINFFKRGSWLQARAITLAFYALISISASPYVGEWFPVMEYDEKTALLLVGVNFIIWFYYRHTLRSRVTKKWEKKLPSRRFVLVQTLISMLKK